MRLFTKVFFILIAVFFVACSSAPERIELTREQKLDFRQKFLKEQYVKRSEKCLKQFIFPSKNVSEESKRKLVTIMREEAKHFSFRLIESDRDHYKRFIRQLRDYFDYNKIYYSPDSQFFDKTRDLSVAKEIFHDYFVWESFYNSFSLDVPRFMRERLKVGESVKRDPGLKKGLQK